MTDWFQRYMNLARHISTWSKDPSTKVGAVIVGRNRRHIAVGYNGPPPGIEDTPGRLNDRELKYRYTQHAERCALDNAWFDTVGSTLIVTMHPCCECAKSIVAKGIVTVVSPGIPDNPRWHQEATWGAGILHEAGVNLVYMEGETDYSLT
jgi:dCMP deaminase